VFVDDKKEDKMGVPSMEAENAVKNAQAILMQIAETNAEIALATKARNDAEARVNSLECKASNLVNYLVTTLHKLDPHLVQQMGAEIDQKNLYRRPVVVA
jgi:hypothetical protein